MFWSGKVGICCGFFPLINTFLRRLRLGRTTWPSFCFPKVKEWRILSFAFSVWPVDSLNPVCWGEEDTGIPMVCDRCPRIVFSDGETLQGDWSWQPFPLMVERDSAKDLCSGITLFQWLFCRGSCLKIKINYKNINLKKNG